MAAAFTFPAGLLAHHTPAPDETNTLAARTAAYFNPKRPGEGIFVEVLPEGRAVLYMFSYGPKYFWGVDQSPLQAPTQTWMIAVGWVSENGIHAEGIQPLGGHFGGAFNPDEIEYRDFGPFFFTFPTCGTSEEPGQLDAWAVGPNTNDYQDLELDNYVQLTTVLDCQTGLGAPNAYYSGSWFDPDRPGEGFIVQVLKDGRALVQWMTFDEVGDQMWMQGIGEFDDTGTFLSVPLMEIYKGTYWGSDFLSSALTSKRFGSLTIEFTSCDTATVTYESGTYGSGTRELERLTTPIKVGDSVAECSED